VSRLADRFLNGGVNREDIGQAGDGKNPHHSLLRCGKYEVTAGLACLPPAAR
jgi:hypothetical protein